MSLELRKKLLTLSSSGLMIAGLIFIILSIFSESKNNALLFASLSCITLANLFHIINNMNNEKQDK